MTNREIREMIEEIDKVKTYGTLGLLLATIPAAAIGLLLMLAPLWIAFFGGR